MTRYVAGFLFDTEGNVVLVKKNRPKWQAGRLNGVGGHVEPGETALEAIKREFWEEAGVRVETWEHFCTLEGPDWEVVFFRSVAPDLGGVRTKTDEEIVVMPLVVARDSSLPLPNISWLLPMAAPKNRLEWPLKVIYN